MSRPTAIALKYSNNAGWRSTHLARETGRPVSVYDGELAGMDTDGGRWQTVCENHGHIISHESLALARSHASNPLGWCGACMGQCPTCGRDTIPPDPERPEEIGWYCEHCGTAYDIETGWVIDPPIPPPTKRAES